MAKRSWLALLVLPLVLLGVLLGRGDAGAVPVITIPANSFLPKHEGGHINLNKNTWLHSSQLTLDPGDVVPWHTHPGPGVLIVIQGHPTFVQADGTSRTYDPGDVLVEEEEHAALNCGTEQAVLRGTFFIECDDPTLQACPPLTAFTSRRPLPTCQ